MAQDAFGPDGLLKPRQHGISDHVAAEYPHFVVSKTELRFAGKTGIADYVGDYAFFTPAILYLYAGFTDAPLADMAEVLGRPVPLYFVRSPVPLFAGLEAPDGNPAWNFGLFAVHRDDWKDLSDWLLTLMLMDAQTGECNAVAEQRVSVLDRGVPVEVMAFASRGSKATWALVQEGPVPRLAKLRPSIGTSAFANALLLGENPVDAATRARTEWIEDKTPKGGPNG